MWVKLGKVQVVGKAIVGKTEGLGPTLQKLELPGDLGSSNGRPALSSLKRSEDKVLQTTEDSSLLGVVTDISHEASRVRAQRGEAMVRRGHGLAEPQGICWVELLAPAV